MKKQQGLYGKYLVLKKDKEKERLVQADSVMFCLDERDPCAWCAIMQYATASNNAELRADILAMAEAKLSDPEFVKAMKWEKTSMPIDALFAIKKVTEEACTKKGA